VGEASGSVGATERQIGAGRRALRIGGFLLVVALGLVTMLAIGIDVGPVAFATGLVLATLPAPLYVWTALRIDRFEPEPLRMLAWAFFWGGSAATFIALVLNTAGQALVGSSFGSDIGELYGASVSAPVVEESAKAAVLFGFYRRRRREIDGILDGMVYAAMVGLGFALTENVLYYGNAAVEGGVPLAATFFVRGVMAPFTHPLFTAMTGIGLGLATQSPRRRRRIALIAGGLFTAMFLHSLWNTAAGVGGGLAFLGVFFGVMVPVFGALIVVVALATRREARTIGERLAPEVATGVLSPGDVMVLTALHERRRLRRAARRDGRAARRAVRDYVRCATELAFLRRRREGALGAPAGDDAAEGELVARLRALRPALGARANAVSTAAAERAAKVAALTAARAGAASGALPVGGHGPGVFATPANWYPDPWRQARWRWWDGRAWTGYTAP